MERTEVQFIPTKFGYCETQTCKTKGEFFIGRPDCSIGNHRVLCGKCVKELIRAAYTIGVDSMVEGRVDERLADVKNKALAEIKQHIQEVKEMFDEQGAAGEPESGEPDEPEGNVTPEPEEGAEDDLEAKEQIEQESAAVLEKLSRDELYEYAKRFDIDGRSKMDKDELIEALLGYAEENDIAFAGVQEE